MKGLGSGAHSHVWKVKIDNHVYALKMFRHIRAEEENAASAAKLERFGIDLQLLNDQLTPFNCEARAYGRLKETGNEDIAWKCYGYIALDEATYSSIVWDKIGLPRKEWFSQYTNTDEEVADKPVFPILALVKEFIPDASKLGALDIAKAHDMAQGINKLHSIGITHRDIQDRNYVDSRIMDFSTSWTVPNIRLDRALKWDPKRSIDEADANDYFMFDDMIEQWNKDHPDLPRSDYRMTQGEKYRPVTKAPGAARRKSSSSSGSSEEMEEIPIMERMRDNRYLVLASSYDWVGKNPAVAQPDILAPLTTVPEDGGDQGPGLPTPPRWPPLAFYVPDSPIAGFPPVGARSPTPDAPWTPPPTTEATVPGPSTPDDQQPPPGPSTLRSELEKWLANLNLTPPRNSEAGKLTAIREAAGNISSTCDALKAMVENLIGIIDRDDSVSPGTQQQQEEQQQQEQQQQQQAAQQPERVARPSRRRPRPHDEDNGVDDSAPPLRRLRPRRK